MENLRRVGGGGRLDHMLPLCWFNVYIQLINEISIAPISLVDRGQRRTNP